MRLSASLLLAAALAAAGAARASADVVLEGVHWQVGRISHGRVAGWQDVRVLEDGPPKLDNRLRARLVLKNRGARPEEGLLLRYSMTARLQPSGGASPADGTWAIPFSIDERRVPKIDAGKMVEVPLQAGTDLTIYLRRLARSGWWPDRVRIQVMLDPRPGSSSIQTVEDVLEIRSPETLP
jgi:hypothetical protein